MEGAIKIDAQEIRESASGMTGPASKSFWVIVEAREEAAKAPAGRRFPTVMKALGAAMMVGAGHLAVARAVVVSLDLAQQARDGYGEVFASMASVEEQLGLFGEAAFAWLMAIVIAVVAIVFLVKGTRAEWELKVQRQRLVELSDELLEAYKRRDRDPEKLFGYAEQASLIALGAYLVHRRIGEYLLDKKTSSRWCPRRKGR